MPSIDVLIVDDNKEFCQLLAEFFEMNEDFNIVEMLYDGEQALEYIKNNKNPDVLIVDLIMPNKDGIAVLEELNEENLIGDMKIVALTAMGHDKIMKTVIDLGVHYYIMKPFDLDLLLKRIRQLVMQVDFSDNSIRYEGQKEDIEEEDYKGVITHIIHDMGVSANLKGYHYIRYGVQLVIYNIDLLSAVTKELYPKIAEEFDSTPSRVERAIRHAIDVVWDRGNPKTIEKFFKNAEEDSKPTNSQFIARIADKIRVDLNVS